MINSKCKILIATGIFPPAIGGPASYAKTLGLKLSAIGLPVTVLTYSKHFNYKEDKKLPFKVVRVWKKNLKFLRHLVYFLKALLYGKKADVIFSLNAVSAGTPSLLAAKLYKKKFIVKIVGDYSWEIAINKKKTFLLINDYQKSKRTGWPGLLHKLQVWVCKNADAVIVPSKYLAELVKDWGVEDGKINVIYNGTDFSPSELSKEEARKQIGIPGSIILSVGRFVPWKGFRMLVKIMPKLLEINQFFRLVLVGDGPEKSVLETMIRNMGLQKKVFLVGTKTKQELAVFLSASDIFILNTGYEGFSHQILEAMSAGVPVITTAMGGNKEIIRQGENGFMVKYNDEFNLVEAVKTVWQEKELREHFITEGKKTLGEFSAEKMFSQTIKLLSS